MRCLQSYRPPRQRVLPLSSIVRRKRPDWRILEAKVAEYFEATRRKMRRYKVQGPDINHPVADIEVKLRAHLPKWTTEIIEKAEKWNTTKLTAVVLYEKGSEAPESGIAILRTPDLKILLEAYQQQVSGPSLPIEALSGSTQTARPRSRWKSRRLKSRKWSS